MKKLALTLSLFAAVSLATGAHVMARGMNSTDYSSSQLHQMIQSRGAIILHTGGGMFDRYVANGSFCLLHEDLAPAFVPTADSSSSFIGYRCEAEYNLHVNR